MALERTDRVLVTGGAGFIGSHLCERLLRDGLDVICLDNFLSGTRSNVEHLQGQVGFELVEHDISEPYRPAERIGAVMHLASPASPRAYQTYPIETIRAGTI
nr:NAD-dependent epimerase/dehydratase family protein [Actinomycetota bacterium]